MKLVKAATVILTFQVPLNVLEQGLNALKASFKTCKLVLRGNMLENFRVICITLGGLGFQLLEDISGGLVLKLDTAAQVDKLGGDAGIHSRVS